jgi:hypothetical protein
VSDTALGWRLGFLMKDPLKYFSDRFGSAPDIAGHAVILTILLPCKSLEAAKSKSKNSPPRPAPLRYGGLRGAGPG